MIEVAIIAIRYKVKLRKKHNTIIRICIDRYWWPKHYTKVASGQNLKVKLSCDIWLADMVREK